MGLHLGLGLNFGLHFGLNLGLLRHHRLLVTRIEWIDPDAIICVIVFVIISICLLHLHIVSFVSMLYFADRITARGCCLIAMSAINKLVS